MAFSQTQSQSSVAGAARGVADRLAGATADKSIAFDLVRVVVAVALIVRGVSFAADASSLFALVERSGLWFWSTAIAHAIVLAHVAGGLLLLAGLATRVMALIQVPVLFGAAFLVHARAGTDQFAAEHAATLMVLTLLVGIFGAGPWSVDARTPSLNRLKPRRSES